MKRAILYTRVSTDDQANFGFSLEHQKERLLLYCKIQGIEVVKIFTDDHSAKNFERPQWKLLEEFVKRNKGAANVIPFTRWDRFSRNAGDAFAVIKQMKALGVAVHSMENPLDTNQPDQKLLLSFHLMLPEIENDKIAIRTIEGMRRGQLSGYWTSKAPYGYINTRLANGKPTLAPSQDATIVRDAFDLVEKGLYSTEEIRRQLEKNGLKLKKQAFYNMLRNKAYIGKIKMNAWGEEEEKYVDGIHEPIIGEEQFNRMQNILDGKKNNNLAQIQVKSAYPMFFLKGSIICEHCERHVTASFCGSRNKSIKHPYFRCQYCKKTNFRADQANEIFIKMLDSLKIPDVIINFFYETMLAKIKSNKDQRLTTKVTLEKEIQELEERKNRAYDLLDSGSINQREYEKQLKRFDSDIDNKLVQLTELGIAEKGLQKHLEASLSIVSRLGHYFEEAAFDIKRKIIGSIFPEKLTFDGAKYRTTEINEVISLLTNDYRALQGIEIKKADRRVGFSSLAP